MWLCRAGKFTAGLSYQYALMGSLDWRFERAGTPFSP